jgi:putative transposase
VTDELHGYMSCGILRRGFAHLYCKTCREYHAVAFSCKARAVCPGCLGRRMSEGALNLVARNLIDPVDGFLRHAKYLVHDRDPLFVEGFTAILRERGVECVKIPAQSPKCNPHAERFVKTIKYECLTHLVLFGERHLRYVVNEFITHYHAERFHQGLGGQLIERQAKSARENGAKGEVACRSPLGGMLNFYVREAA